MGTGGSRYGAGRPATHVKAEHCRRIDVRRWQREGILNAGRAGAWQWTDSDTGEVLASIGYRASEHAVMLNYSIDDKPSNQTVGIGRTACTYGGSRPWFICPIRGERVAVLYLRAGRFACRHCQRLAYASQSDDACGRAWRKQSKIEAKLDEDWTKPKGMHWSTHERLVDRLVGCERAKDEALAAFLARLPLGVLDSLK